MKKIPDKEVVSRKKSELLCLYLQKKYKISSEDMITLSSQLRDNFIDGYEYKQETI